MTVSPLARAPRRVLVLCTRRLGDVLLTTPLLRSLRRAWPEAELDVLTLQWSASALEGNPDVSRVIPIAQRASVRESLRAIGGFRRYDLAVSTLHDDRPHALALWAAGTRSNITPPAANGAWWKRRLSTRSAALGEMHTVVQYLRLADALGLPRCNEVVPPRVAAGAEPVGPAGPYVVVHPGAMFAYKRWTVAGWQAVLRWLVGQGLHVLLDAGPGEVERAQVEAILRDSGLPEGAVSAPTQVLSFAQLASLMAAARLYIGPDTGVTHLAAATGVRTIALFGSMSPLRWGPWPQGFAGSGPSPWREQAPLQHASNVWIVQGLTHCAPCLLEGCERHLASRADCLDQLPASRVIAAAAAALAG